MDNVLLSLNTEISNGEYFAYFAPEIFYVFGIILNIILYLFFKRKDKTKRLSDFFTGSIFAINTLILSGLCLRNHISIEDINFGFCNDIFYYNNDLTSIKALLSLFGLFYVFVMYRILRKTRIKTALLNSILLTIVLATNFLLYCVNFIATYLLLELLILLIYKYASSMRIRKDSIFSSKFISISLSATFLFTAFFIVGLFVKDEMQQVIISSCLTISILLKVGIFPFYNYLIDKNLKTNIPYAVLMSAYLPIVAVISFAKFMQKFAVFSETYQISVSFFLVLSLFLYSLSVPRQKSILKLCSTVGFSYLIFSILNILYMGSIANSLTLVLCISFALMGLYSLILVLKLNYNPEKLYLATFKGIFLKNKNFALLFSFALLILSGIFPSIILKLNTNILTNIYTFDKVGIYALICIIFAGMLLMFKIFGLIKTCYSYSKNEIKDEFTKRTTLNYIVPVVIIVFLIISFIL